VSRGSDPEIFENSAIIVLNRNPSIGLSQGACLGIVNSLVLKMQLKCLGTFVVRLPACLERHSRRRNKFLETAQTSGPSVQRRRNKTYWYAVNFFPKIP
jgi:hypothetical protein